jgi:hypothetical protein
MVGTGTERYMMENGLSTKTPVQIAGDRHRGGDFGVCGRRDRGRLNGWNECFASTVYGMG